MTERVCQAVYEFDLELVWEWKGERCNKADYPDHDPHCGERPSPGQMAELRELARTHGFRLRKAR